MLRLVKQKIIKKLYVDGVIKTVSWPAKSPDINITEDIWKMILELVYDGLQYHNKKELKN